MEGVQYVNDLCGLSQLHLQAHHKGGQEHWRASWQQPHQDSHSRGKGLKEGQHQCTLLPTLHVCTLCFHAR